MREWIGWLGHWALRILLGAMLASILPVVLFRFVPLPGSMVMLERWSGALVAGEPYALHYRWTPWESLSDEAKLAVIAAEDQNFPDHFGFDFGQIRDAIQAWREGRTLRGASTISQQTAKNVFLWSDRSFLRKGLEVWFTFLIELIWPKQRILEVYLNVAEWDRGVFGLAAAAEHYYGIEASQVDADRAARLAAVLPNPLEWNPLNPNPHMQQRTAWIRQQMRQLGGVGYLQRL